jgi:hypothetical protein
MLDIDTQSILSAIPDALSLRRQLAQTLRHAGFLRALIRVADLKDKESRTSRRVEAATPPTPERGRA